MKKFLFAAAIAATMGLASCNVVSNSAYTQVVDTQMYNRSVADLVVSDQVITYTYTVDKAHARGGEKSAKAAAVSAALKANGGGDLIVNPQFEVKKRKNLCGTKVTEVTVTGHPATYKHIHPMTQQEADILTQLKGRKK